MAYDLKTRQLLNEAGIGNERIGFDNANQSVTVDGRVFMKPQRVLSGTAFTDRPSFNQALESFNKPVFNQEAFAQAIGGRDIQAEFRNKMGDYKMVDVIDPQGNLKQVRDYQTGPLSYQGYKPAGQGQGTGTQGTGQAGVTTPVTTATAAPTQTATYTPPVNPMDAQIRALLDAIMSQIQNPQTFDPYASPAFAAQEARSQRAAQQGIRAAQEALGSAGFGRSTALAQNAQQIQNEQEDFLRTQVIPQIIAQEQSREQQEINNLLDVLSPLYNQQQLLDTRGQQTFKNQQFLERQDLLNQLTEEQITGAGLTNETNRLMLESLPEEIQLNLQDLRNSVAKGDVDLQIAEEELDRLIDPNSFQNQTAKLALETAQLENLIAQIDAQNLPEQYKLQMQELRIRINQLNQAPKQTPEQITVAKEEAEQARIQTQILLENLKKLQGANQPAVGMTPEEFAIEREEMASTIRDLRAAGTLNLEAEVQRIREDERIGLLSPTQAEELIRNLYVLAGSVPALEDPRLSGVTIDPSELNLPDLNMTVTESAFGRR